jgi:hypothetical protein
LAPGQFLLVLSDSELEAAAKKFGIHFPMKIERFFMDREQKRAHFEWSASWKGGALLLKKEGDKWVVNVLSSWIT